MKRMVCLLWAVLLLTGCAAAPSRLPEYNTVVIAMLDTGISTIAIDSSSLLAGHNYVTDSDDTQDLINHGTATASVIVGCESAEIPGAAPQVRQRLFDGAVDVNAPGWDPASGWGILSIES